MGYDIIYIVPPRKKDLVMLMDEYPSLALQWSSRNTLGLEDISSGSSRKVWWICEKGHEWEAVIHHRTSHSVGCPFCSGRLPILGVTDLASRNPTLTLEWSARNPKPPSDYTYVSGKRVWWVGECGHEWEAKISNRVNGTGCPVCVGRKILVGFNDLNTTHADLVKEWSPNNEITPNEVTKGSKKRVLWLCPLGHEYESVIKDRSKPKKPYGCPYCAGILFKPGYNDLLTMYPDISESFSIDNKADPSQIHCHNRNIKYLWECKNKHVWKSTVANRTQKSRGCPWCVDLMNPQVEIAVASALESILEDSPKTHVTLSIPWRTRRSMEVDILCGTLVVEYDGSVWHKNPEKFVVDSQKTLALLDSGYTVLRIREKPLKLLDLEHPNFLQISHRWGLNVEEWVDVFRSLDLGT